MGVVQLHSTGIRSTLSVSQGTEVELVTEYVPYRYYTSYASVKTLGEPVYPAVSMLGDRPTLELV